MRTSTLVILLFIGSAGCQHTLELSSRHCRTIPAGAIPQPLGSFSCRWQTEQAQQADQDKLTIYEYEWLEGGATLGPFGQRHLERIAQSCETQPWPIVIQSSQDPQQDAVRRETVIAALAGRVPGIEDRVIVAKSRALGLFGTEAPRIAHGYGSSNTTNGSQGRGNARSSFLGQSY